MVNVYPPARIPYGERKPSIHAGPPVGNFHSHVHEIRPPSAVSNAKRQTPNAKRQTPNSALYGRRYAPRSRTLPALSARASRCRSRGCPPDPRLSSSFRTCRENKLPHSVILPDSVILPHSVEAAVSTPQERRQQSVKCAVRMLRCAAGTGCIQTGRRGSCSGGTHGTSSSNTRHGRGCDETTNGDDVHETLWNSGRAAVFWPAHVCGIFAADALVNRKFVRSKHALSWNVPRARPTRDAHKVRRGD